MTVWAQSNHYFFLLPMVQKSPSSFKGVSLRKLAVYSRNVCFPELNTKSADSVYLNIYVSNSEDMLLSSFLRIRPCNNSHIALGFSPALLPSCSHALQHCCAAHTQVDGSLWACGTAPFTPVHSPVLSSSSNAAGVCRSICASVWLWSPASESMEEKCLPPQV